MSSRRASACAMSCAVLGAAVSRTIHCCPRVPAGSVQVAAPAVHDSLPGPVADVQWFSAAYTLPFVALLITGGRLGDLAGCRRVFRLGVTAFLLTSLACALAPDAGALIVFRAAQGPSTAVIIPQTIGLIRAMFTDPALSRALGAIGPVMGLAAVCGPVLGGVLTAAWTWRSAFLVNVPLSVIVLLLARGLPEDRVPGRPRLDLPGTVLAVLGLGLLVQPLTQLSTPDYRLLAAGAVVLVVLVLHQRRSRAHSSNGPWSPDDGSRPRWSPRRCSSPPPRACPWPWPCTSSWTPACLVRDHAVVLGALGVIGIGAGLFSPAYFTAALRAVRRRGSVPPRDCSTRCSTRRDARCRAARRRVLRRRRACRVPDRDRIGDGRRGRCRGDGGKSALSVFR
ncbi:MFS transporter [Amycolatopsis thermoflava]|uniref:MFS transporter n=1 Tax=Amycolatopsis thermoflava TaxID=84480 RepID=UPI0036613BED